MVRLSLPGLCAIAAAATTTGVMAADCPDYTEYAKQRHGPYSEGKYKLSFQRPAEECRKFKLPEAEAAIEGMRGVVKDPDLFRLFENAFPNTLDTTITWRGFAADNPDEELTFITTGDIVAMWLRDSANQLRSYKSLLEANSSTDSLASLYRGAINLQARFVQRNPYCNAFQAPAESGLPPETNSFAETDVVRPPFDPADVFECKYELDSISAFLQLSWDYYDRTGDAAFFGRFAWPEAVRTILDAAEALRVPTYADDGAVNDLPYTFRRTADSASETLSNEGRGAPVRGGTGLVRSAFRPSDDSTIYQLFIPANMQFASYLGKCVEIARKLGGEGADGEKLADRMEGLASSVREGVERHGKVSHAEFGDLYAFEVDGYGSANLMDDANIPSLLSAPLLGFLGADDPTYRNTRRFALSKWNPYYNWGPVFQGIGGPHQGPGKAWPMSIIASILTSDDEAEVSSGLRSIVSTTDGLGLVHESINTFNASDWTRQWFSWANGLFGEMVLELNRTRPAVLGMSFQD